MLYGEAKQLGKILHAFKIVTALFSDKSPIFMVQNVEEDCRIFINFSSDLSILSKNRDKWVVLQRFPL
jgi:hypothetical protein